MNVAKDKDRQVRSYLRYARESAERGLAILKRMEKGEDVPQHEQEAVADYFNTAGEHMNGARQYIRQRDGK